MERLTTGRRHIRAGSVHVTELIGKQPAPHDIAALDPAGDTEPGADGTNGALESLLDPGHQPPSSHRRQPSKGAQLAKIAGLGVASFVLCGSIAFASMITHQRRDNAEQAAAARPTMEISGEQALLPDELNRAVPRSAKAAMPTLPGAPANASGSIDNDGRAPMADAAPAGQPGDGGQKQAATDDSASRKQLVEEFYRLIPTSPDKAFRLLDATLLGTDLAEFLQSWAMVTDVEVLDVRGHGDDVLAVIRMQLPDGSHLRVQQLLNVAVTAPRRIVGAEILSAQRN